MDRNFQVLVEGEFSRPRKIATGVPQCSIILYTNSAAAATGTHLAHLADDTCIYAAEKYERLILCKLQRGLTAVKSWCERWNIGINEGKSQAMSFSRIP
jgi:hypothetical protein